MTREQKQHILHFAVSSLGGFMGGYAIYNHCDVFGNAQTANMIHLVSKIFTGDFEGVVFIAHRSPYIYSRQCFLRNCRPFY